MSFFAAAEGIAAPDLQGAGAAARGGQELGIEEAEEDWWKCLVRFDPDTGKMEWHICSPQGRKDRQGREISDRRVFMYTS